MIRVATRVSVVSTIVSRFSNKKFERSVFCRYKNTRGNCSEGYVVKLSKSGCFSNRTSNGNELFIKQLNTNFKRQFSTEEDLKSLSFERISNETLESLSEYFDEIIENASHLQDADVSYGDGVLTIKFGKEYGTYVLNRQVPNQQIWLSSPKSGPKRYDFIDGIWIYKHDGKSLHELLNNEISDIVKSPVSFDKCSYGIRNK